MQLKKNIILIALMIQIIQLQAQRETHIWYFGEYAGIEFNDGVATPLTDGVLHRWEGVATFSDSLGNLLLYTDGNIVWDKKHEVMPNGSDLLGDSSSTESAIIVPYPEKKNLYYIFTVDAEGGSDGLCYSLVDMNLNNGYGDITGIKNINLIARSSEKVTAVRHSNNRDFWVISHEYETDSFYVYLVDNNGLNTTPQIYELGTPHDNIGLDGNNAVGYMRVAPNGQKIALALQVTSIVEIYDFDPSTGVISNPITIYDPEQGTYGIEFSPDCSKLYYTSKYSLFQVDLNAGTAEDIKNSVVKLGNSDSENYLGAVQLATDGKIYVTHEFSNYLGIINNPEKKGTGCNFELNGFYLAGKKSRMGLPNFIQTYFLPPDFEYKNICFSDTTQFYLKDETDIESVEWVYKDMENNIISTSTEFKPKYVFPDSVHYKIELTMYRNGIPYQKSQIIKINSLPEFSFVDDIVLCNYDSVVLNVPELTNCTLIWNDNYTDYERIIKAPDAEYWAFLTNTYTQCQYSDTISIHFNIPVAPKLGNDTSFCINDSLLIGTDNKFQSIKWNTGAETPKFYAVNIGKYWIDVIDFNNCINSDTINLSYYQLPEVNLGNDTILCENTEILYDMYQKKAKYIWQDASTNSSYNVTMPGKYWVHVTDSLQCKNADTVTVEGREMPNFNLGNDTTVCEEVPIMLHALVEYAEKYTWQDNSTYNSLIAKEQGIYWLDVTNVCGTVRDSIEITHKYCGDFVFPNIITPNNDGVNEYFKIKGLKDKNGWSLKFLNRSGKLVYKSTDYQNDWNAPNLPEGVYFYIFSKNNHKFTGYVHVIR